MPITDTLHLNCYAIHFSLINEKLKWRSFLKDHKDLQGQSRDRTWLKICLSTLEEIQITPQTQVGVLLMQE